VRRAAQRAVTAFAGYLVIMRGKTFTVGDRIKMGGVRGDVIALGFLRTRILESLSSDSPDRPQELAGVQIFRIDVDRVLYRIRGFA
jgi:small-conductance mechanosensitive channel